MVRPERDGWRSLLSLLLALASLSAALVAAREDRSAGGSDEEVIDCSLDILDRIPFRRSSAAIPSRTAPILDAIADTLKAYPQIELVEITGHATDDEPAAKQLSMTRAEAVRGWLVRRGVAGKRLVSLGAVTHRAREAATAQAARHVSFHVARRAEGASPNPASDLGPR